MRLFQRNLLSFIAVIVLSSAFTGLLVTGLIEQDQAKDSSRELVAESMKVCDDFNAWKIALWKVVVGLKERQDRFGADLPAEARTLAAAAGADFLVIRTRGHAPAALILQPSPRVFPEPAGFRVSRDQPYIEITVLPGAPPCPAFVGAVRLSGAWGEAEVFVGKVIGENLLSSLTSDPRYRVLLFSGRTPQGRRMTPVGTLGAEGLLARWTKEEDGSGYMAFRGVKQDRSEFDALVQSSGTIVFDGLSPVDSPRATLFVATLSSQQENLSRLEAIRRTVLVISLLSATLTIVLSLFLSGTITSPIRRLLSAMRLVQGGDYRVRVKLEDRRGPSEIRELLGGFDAMSERLGEDREAMDRSLAEILNLKEYNDQVINGIREGIVVVGADWRVEKANQAFLDLFSLTEEELVGFPLPALGIFDGSLAQMVGLVLDQTVPRASETRRDAQGRAYEVRLYPIHGERPRCILIAENVSEKLLYEQKIYQAEKLASISMLSAGVAHEINNPLASILTNVQYLMGEERFAEKRELLALIESETKRIARIVRELLDFSSGSRDADSAGADVGQVVEQVLSLIRYSAGNASVRLVSDVPPACRVDLSEDELKQVLINLVKNSLQALPTGGIITLSARSSPQKGFVSLTVEDTGEGIPQDVLPRIFDPFFTTKESSVGTGLGLSVVYGILTKRGGQVRVESREHRGTTVFLEIPERAEE